MAPTHFVLYKLSNFVKNIQKRDEVIFSFIFFSFTFFFAPNLQIVGKKFNNWDLASFVCFAGEFYKLKLVMRSFFPPWIAAPFRLDSTVECIYSIISGGKYMNRESIANEKLRAVGGVGGRYGPKKGKYFKLTF